MTKDISTKPLSGYMELGPGEQRTFNELLDTIRSIYELNGYIAMDQPVVDRTEVLLANVGGDTTKELIRVERDDEKGHALRFDLTVPLSRYVVEKYGELVFPFRRYAIGKVYRGERPQAGRFREFYQCDVDIIGNEKLSVRHDGEVVLIIGQLFEKLDIGPFRIRINNRKLFDGLFAELRLGEIQAEVMRLIDKKEKITDDEFVRELDACNIQAEQKKIIHAFLESAGVDDLKKLSLSDPQFKEGIHELERVLSICEASELSDAYFVFDPTIVRGLDYYTGTVFETQLIDYPEIGSVCSGGRYDNLASAFTSRKLPGVGVSIGLTRLFDQLIKKGVLQPSVEKTNSQVLVLPIEEGQMEYALAMQSDLHKSNVACEVSFAESKLDKRMSYANKLGIKYVILLGEDEARSGAYTLKNMSDGSEQALDTEEIIKHVTQ